MGHPEFENVFKIIKKLRDPVDGCPWDLKQTHQSLTRYLIEESYEFQQACQHNIPKEIEDEIGDVLLQVLLHATIGEENNHFTLETISKNLAEKMIRRHPHVFSEDREKISEREVKENWEKIKSEETNDQTMKSLSYLPGLLGAHKIGEKTNRVGFDWKNAQEVLPIVQGELDEFLDELNESTSDAPSKEMKEEFGDLLFSMAQLGRHLNINAEEALQSANSKFIRRYNRMQELIEKDGQNMNSMNQAEMDVYWVKVKEEEHAHS